jgi:hypothetical protein
LLILFKSTGIDLNLITNRLKREITSKCMSGILSYITRSASKITFLPKEHMTIDGHAEKAFFLHLKAQMSSVSDQNNTFGVLSSRARDIYFTK